jgi:hypothetical protein
MANVHVTPQLIAKMIAVYVGEDIGKGFFTNVSNRLLPEYQGKTNKPGATVRFRKPYRQVASDSLAWNPQPLVDQIGTCTVNNIASVQNQWDIVEQTLEVEEVMEYYVRPAGNALRGKITEQLARFCVQNAQGAVGTPGTAPTGPLTYLQAGDVLVEQGMPDQTPNLILNRRMSTAFVDGTKTLFNSAGTIGGQFDRGKMVADTLGYKIFQDQATPVLTNGVFAGTPLVNGGNQAGSNGNNGTQSLITDGWTSTSLNKNTKFVIGSAASATVGGVESVHPVLKTSNGRQQVFSVTEDITDSAGAITMTISPAMTLEGAMQNVNSIAVDNAIITVFGTTGAQQTMGILMAKDSFGFLSVPLAELYDGVKCITATDPKSGFSVMQSRWGDGQNMQNNMRYDCLFAPYAQFPELATVVYA